MSKQRDVAELKAMKRAAAEQAVLAVQSGMVVGLGHGSTTVFAIRRIGEWLKEGRLRDVRGVPCSSRVRADADRFGVPLVSLEEEPALDLTIDGADEVDERLNLIKGGGGALLREKVVAQASRREIIVVDETKLSPALGNRSALPVEVVRFAERPEREFLESLGARVTLRQGEDGRPFLTDQGNVILDCDFGPTEDPNGLANRLEARAGIMAHGLFLGLASEVLVGVPGGVRRLRPPPACASREG